RRPAAGGVPGAPPLAGHRLRPASARQPGVDRRYPADSGAAAQARRPRGARGARLRPARQSLAQRPRRPGARIRTIAAGALRAVPLRQRRRRPGDVRAWPSRRTAGRGVPAGGAGRASRSAGMNAQPGFPVALADRLARPLRDLRLSVIEACNFRCGYCMPADRIPDDYGLDAAGRLSFDQIVTLARVAAGLGATKLRITGGEPLLRRDLAGLIERL